MSDLVGMEFQTCYSNSLTVMCDTKEEVQRAYEIMKIGSKTISNGGHAIQLLPGCFYRQVWNPLVLYDRAESDKCRFEDSKELKEKEKSMSSLEKITEAFVKESREILGDNLVGIYLHGSAVMGCFSEKKSDIDLLVVVNEAMSDAIKTRYMDMVVRLNAAAPEKGIEMSVVRKAVCRPFVYPTPFELHFSISHLEWYRTNPADYVVKMKGTDKDLAAHFSVIYHRGQCLYGEEIKAAFEKVSRENYFDSILSDIEDAQREILNNPVYIALNLCRVLAYKRDGLILSKKEGAEWGLSHLPEKYHALISQALGEYTADEAKDWNVTDAREYAAYMLEAIRDSKETKAFFR